MDIKLQTFEAEVFSVTAKKPTIAIGLVKKGLLYYVVWSVTEPVFKDWKNGQYKMINFYAKKARGLMSRYAIDHQINDPEALKNFDYEGYGFSENDSDEQNWVFTRKLTQ